MKTKVCNKCNEEKPIDNFYSNGYTPKGSKKYKPSCKLCENSIKKKNHRYKIAHILTSLGREYKCEICGYNKNYSALAFHHNKGKKNFEINVAKSRSYESVKEEIKLCQLLCFNCHQEVHNPYDNIES